MVTTGRSEVKKHVRELFKHINRELKESIGDGGPKGNEYRQQFFSHLKNWLAPRFKSVGEADLRQLQSSTKEFESEFSEIVNAVKGNDSDNVNFYTDSLEELLGECKATYSLEK